MIKFALFDIDFIENMPSEILSELITFDDAIPDDIKNYLCEYNPTFKRERREYIEQPLRNKIQKLRFEKEQGFKEIGLNIHYEKTIAFIKKYPQFTCLIDSICFFDDDLNNLIKEVPIEEYLASEDIKISDELALDKNDENNIIILGTFDDGVIWDLDKKLVNGEITLEEYIKISKEICFED